IFRPGNRHTKSKRRCGSGAINEGYALWFNCGRIFQKFRTCRKSDETNGYRNRILELLRQGKRGVALVGTQKLRFGCNIVLSWYQSICAAEGVSYEGVTTHALYCGLTRDDDSAGSFQKFY